MRKLLLFLSLSVLPLFAQVQDTSKAYDYPYSMPIWGQKAADRGIKLQLPYGFNVNYVFNQMELEISRFGMTVGSDPLSPINDALNKYVNSETLNFKKTEAITNGMNFRADVWLFPFWNVYGLFSSSVGSTGVSLQPTWYDDSGDLVLALPEFSTVVEFSANTVGIGSTFAYGIDDHFFSVDANYTQSYSEILTEPAQFMVVSARVGERLDFKNDMKLALYVGGMWRGFVESDGNFGAVTFEEVFPEIGSRVFPAIDAKLESNNQKIAAISPPSRPSDVAELAKLEAQNVILGEIDAAFESAFSQDINYEIEKDIVNNWSVQFGFNFEINEKLAFRGEFGKGTGNSFVLTGIQYRFGL